MLSRHPRAEEPQSVQKWYFFGDIKKNAELWLIVVIQLFYITKIVVGKSHDKTSNSINFGYFQVT